METLNPLEKKEKSFKINYLNFQLTVKRKRKLCSKEAGKGE